MSFVLTHRPDGWPLCPQCGEDELMSIKLHPTPMDHMLCLYCRWEGIVPERVDHATAEALAEDY